MHKPATQPIAQPKQGTSYGGSAISKDPTKNMRLAAAKWQAEKLPQKAR